MKTTSRIVGLVAIFAAVDTPAGDLRWHAPSSLYYASAVWLVDDSGDGRFTPGETVWIFYEVVNESRSPLEIEVRVIAPDLWVPESVWLWLKPETRHIPGRPIRAVVKESVRPRTMSPVDLHIGPTRRGAFLFVEAPVVCPGEEPGARRNSPEDEHNTDTARPQTEPS